MPVYIIQAGDRDLVKIGWSKDYPDQRVSVLQIGCPDTLKILHVFDAHRLYEGFLHKKFEKYRIRGEWFQFSDEIEGFIFRSKELECLARKKKAEEEYEKGYIEWEQEQEEAYNRYLEKQAEKYWEEQEENHWEEIDNACPSS